MARETLPIVLTTPKEEIALLNLEANDNHGNPELDLEKQGDEVSLADFDHGSWSAAVKGGTVESVQSFLDTLSEEQCGMLVNRPLNLKSKTKKFSGKLRFQLPLFLAVVRRSRDIIEILLSNGADIHAVESHVGNVVHALCWSAFFFPEKEEELVDVYNFLLDSIGCSQASRDLLTCEDADGLRPLELAAKLGTFLVFEAILDTGNVYKVSAEQNGIYEEVTYDFTEYEKRGNDGRNFKSPLRFFRYLENIDLKKAGCERVLSESVINEWIGDKVVRNRLAMVLWFLSRLIFILSHYSIYTYNFGGSGSPGNYTRYTMECPTTEPGVFVNKTISPYIGTEYVLPRSALYVSALFIASFLLCFVFSSIVNSLLYLIGCRRRQLYRRPWSKNTSGYVISCFFQVCHNLLIIFFLVDASAATGNHGDNTSRTVTPHLILSSWSIFYFLRLVPGIDHLIIGFQKMINLFFNFLILAIIVFIPFALSFFVANETQCLDASFSNPIISVYSTFLVTLNLVDFNQTTTTTSFYFMFLHVALVIILVFLTLNFLVAILSEGIQEASNSRLTLLVLQKLDVSIEVEDALFCLCCKCCAPCCKRCCCCCCGCCCKQKKYRLTVYRATNH